MAEENKPPCVVTMHAQNQQGQWLQHHGIYSRETHNNMKQGKIEPSPPTSRQKEKFHFSFRISKVNKGFGYFVPVDCLLTFRRFSIARAVPKLYVLHEEH
jgi:hypothetical protein